MANPLTKSILIIEDETPIREMIRFVLENAGFSVVEAEDGKQAELKMAQSLPQLILLDWMLPNISGVDITKRIRANPITQDIPIIMLTAKAEENSRIRGLESGADDYVVKPFSPKELVARIKTVLRRGPLESPAGILKNHALVMDPSNHWVTIAEKPVKLSPTEFRLLHFFMTHKDRVYSREQILYHVWNGESDIDDRTVDVHIRRLRKNLADFNYDKYLQTVRGAGYRLASKL